MDQKIAFDSFTRYIEYHQQNDLSCRCIHKLLFDEYSRFKLTLCRMESTDYVFTGNFQDDRAYLLNSTILIDAISRTVYCN